MTSTGKKARKRYGNRYAAKRRRDAGAGRKKGPKQFGSLTYSTIRGNVQSVKDNTRAISDLKGVR